MEWTVATPIVTLFRILLTLSYSQADLQLPFSSWKRCIYLSTTLSLNLAIITTCSAD